MVYIWLDNMKTHTLLWKAFSLLAPQWAIFSLGKSLGKRKKYLRKKKYQIFLSSRNIVSIEHLLITNRCSISHNVVNPFTAIGDKSWHYKNVKSLIRRRLRRRCLIRDFTFLQQCQVWILGFGKANWNLIIADIFFVKMLNLKLLADDSF